MNRTAKVALACFIGTALGILVMLELKPALWPFGLVAGFLSGYLSYEFKRAVQAVPLAWRYAAKWRPDWEWWRLYFRAIPACFVFGITVGMGLTLFVLGGMLLDKPHHIPWSVLYGLGISGMAMGGTIGAILGPMSALATPEKYEEELHSVWKGNPFRIYLWLPLVGAWWLLRHIPDGIVLLLALGYFALNFLWKFFKLVHSEERLLCGVDAAIGVAVCHYTGNNVLLGLASGVIWGVLNFEILSIRVLKLAPATASLFYRR